MSIEFFLELLAVVFVLGCLAWVYCAVFDFVDEWKKKARLRREAAAEGFPLLYGEERVEARLPPMALASRYGMDHELPAGPPEGWAKRPSLPKAARMMD